jgi:N-carbamoylputrescine amidase
VSKNHTPYRPAQPAQPALTAALVQHRCDDDLDANLARSLAGIAEAAERGAELVLLPELHRSRYFCQRTDPALFDLAEPIPGPTTAALAAAAARHRLVVVGSVFERRAPGLYHNTAVVFDRDGSLAGRYRKMHIPDDPGYGEKFYFTPGDLGFQPIDTTLGRLGVLVCWDQWFPEAARLMAMAGAELLLYPTAIGWDMTDDAEERARQLDAWITVQRAHAICNGLPVLSANRWDAEPLAGGGDPAAPGTRFWGNSFIAGAQGELLASAGSDADQVLVVTIERTRSERVRRIWPFLRDRRIDHYQDLPRLYRDAPQ